MSVSLPGVAGVVVCSVELPELLPAKVGDGERLSSGHHGVGVVWVQLILEVLRIHTLVFGLQEHTHTQIRQSVLQSEKHSNKNSQ